MVKLLGQFILVQEGPIPAENIPPLEWLRGLLDKSFAQFCLWILSHTPG
jgi:hypothetical protein